MCRTQYVLALVALYVGLAHSWDIAVGVGDQLIFYTDGIKTNSVDLISRNITAIAYNEVQNSILYVDKQSDNDAICGYYITTMENKCFIKRNGSNIEGIAFDPATETLFFTDSYDNSINMISLKSINNVKANILIKMDDRTPIDIAVDSCEGYIYWTNIEYGGNLCLEYAERARLNGSQREVIRDYKNMKASSLTIDPQTRKNHYLSRGSTLYLDRADSNGQNNLVILYYLNRYHAGQYAAKELTVSKDYLYWVLSNENNKIICQVPKNAKPHFDVKEILDINMFSTEKPLAIAANYKMKDQIHGRQDCEALSSMIPTITVPNNSLNIEQTTEHISETPVPCALSYTGCECDVSVCQNYCLHGTCSTNIEGLPSCRCEAGYTGGRCEVSKCHGYCLNDGVCSLGEYDEPFCQCGGNHEGSRCEINKPVSFTALKNRQHNLNLVDALRKLMKISVTVEV